MGEDRILYFACAVAWCPQRLRKKNCYAGQGICNDRWLCHLPKKDDCDYLLQIKLIREEVGVAVIIEKRNKDRKLVWNYGHIAYEPNDFIPIVSYVSRKIK